MESCHNVEWLFVVSAREQPKYLGFSFGEFAKIVSHASHTSSAVPVSLTNEQTEAIWKAAEHFKGSFPPKVAAVSHFRHCRAD